MNSEKSGETNGASFPHNYIRLRSLRPWAAQYLFLDDADHFYGEAEFDKVGVHVVKYFAIMESPEHPGVNLIFCRVLRWEAKKFEKAMERLDKRMAILKPDYGEMKDMIARMTETAKEG